MEDGSPIPPGIQPTGDEGHDHMIACYCYIADYIAGKL